MYVCMYVCMYDNAVSDKTLALVVCVCVHLCKARFMEKATPQTTTLFMRECGFVVYIVLICVCGALNGPDSHATPDSS